MKKILFVNSGFGPGGAEHQCTQLMEMLADVGYEVSTVTFEDIPDHYKLSEKVSRKRIAPGKPLWQKMLALEWYLLTTKTEVVFGFSQRMSVLTLFPMLFRPSIKSVACERNCTIGTPTIFEKILMKTQIYRRADVVVPNSYSQGQYLANKMPCLKNRIKVVTNYTELDTYNFQPLENHKITRIGLFCRLEAQKNFHGFIKMVDALCKQTDQEFVVEWYGANQFVSSSQTEYFNEGIDLIKKLGLQDKIKIMGPTNKVSELIPSFDVLCLPSFKEGFSNSISEYICCGRPVLCSDVSDNSVMVHDGENGFLFDPNDQNSMVGAFLKYLNTSQIERTSMCERSRQIAEELFNKKKFGDSYIEIIEK